MSATSQARAKRVAVLGAGIMGSSVALELSRRGHQVVLVDAADTPFSGASRWSEGKLHLGYLYAADPSLSTARHVLPGGVAFVDQVTRLIGCDLEPAISVHDDTYLVHRESVVDSDTMRARFKALSALIRTWPGADGYPGDASNAHVRELSRAKLDQLADGHLIQAGFRVPERSISTCWVADRYIDALSADPRIELALSTYVRGVRPVQGMGLQRWEIDTDRQIDGSFDAVVNALWEGRLAVDRVVGLPITPNWSHRYRLSLFVHTRRPLATRSMVIATGPFGDIKNYNGCDFYLSWYPAGLLVEGHEIDPPRIPFLDAPAREAIIEAIRRGLGEVIPSAHEVMENADSVQLQGGWVFAQGRGPLADPTSTLHRRDHFGICREGSYFSVDTGKYSTAPWLARQIAECLA